MRRALPWSLLALVGLGSGLGAFAGVSSAPGSSASAWVINVLRTTASAGTAHFDYSQITTSANPAERDDSVGSGQVNFTTGSVRTTAIEHDTQATGGSSGSTQEVLTTQKQLEINIGSTLYSTVLINGHAAPWFKVNGWHDARVGFGLVAAPNAGAAFDGLVGGQTPVAQVREIGATTLNGEATTRYQVTDAPPQICPSARKSALTEAQGPTTVWIDAKGRLVQVQVSIHFKGHIPARELAKLPAEARAFANPSTTTTTFRLTDFGAPVHIAPPPSRMILGNGGSSSRIAIALKKCGS
jgi:hypothetical protein